MFFLQFFVSGTGIGMDEEIRLFPEFPLEKSSREYYFLRKVIIVREKIIYDQNRHTFCHPAALARRAAA